LKSPIVSVIVPALPTEPGPEAKLMRLFKEVEHLGPKLHSHTFGNRDVFLRTEKSTLFVTWADILVASDVSGEARVPSRGPLPVFAKAPGLIQSTPGMLLLKL